LAIATACNCSVTLSTPSALPAKSSSSGLCGRAGGSCWKVCWNQLSRGCRAGGLTPLRVSEGGTISGGTRESMVACTASTTSAGRKAITLCQSMLLCHLLCCAGLFCCRLMGSSSQVAMSILLHADEAPCSTMQQQTHITRM